jgi:DNA-binding winged helix-turn-helix (wHTH) protein/Tol biopolymer transport system component
MALLLAAGLLLRGLYGAQTVDPGFEIKGVASFRLKPEVKLRFSSKTLNSCHFQRSSMLYFTLGEGAVAVAVYQFGDFRLDGGRFELLRNGHVVRLERKPMELLILLLARNGQLVSRTEIAEYLWSGQVFVDTEHGINTAIRKIRQALGDDPENPRFVQTITGKGYLFSAPISAISPAESQPEPARATPPPSRRTPVVWLVAGVFCALLAIAGMAFYRSHHRPPEITYTQLTDLTDSAVAPALSPDGRMLAFIRGSDAFLSADQIYIKMLPNGEPKRLTDDSRPKYGLAFSPDDSEIAYTVMEAPVFSTYSVSVLGGESHLMLRNAAGLVWLDPHQLLYSQTRSGIHLGVVTSTETRADLREIYFPSHERGMAHYAYPSPDRHWALVVEMNGNGDWAQCRLISLDGQRPTRSIGPAGACTSAGWSPDGSWMYFAAAVEGSRHLWRQRFPGGAPEQITFGPTEEDGIAVEPTGRSLITSVGVHESAIWIHGPDAERPLSSEGEVVSDFPPPSFSANDTMIYYLLRRGQEGSGAELWRTMVESGKSEAVFPGVSMLAYDVSPDGKQVVYATAAPGGTSQMWLAPVDRSIPASRVGNTGGRWPHFGARGQILFQQTEGNSNYLEQVDLDGSNQSKVVPYPIIEIQSVSPGRRWVMAAVPKSPDGNGPAVVAIPVDGGPPRLMCVSYCVPRWSTSGVFLLVPVEQSSRTSPGRSLAIPVGPGESLPVLPPGGIAPLAEPIVVKGAQSVPRENLVPGKDPEHFAYVNTTVHRNLYRISLP